MAWQLGCANLWPDSIIKIKIEVWRIFTRFQLWAHKLFVKCIPGWNMECAWGSAFELSLTFEGWLFDQIRDQRPISLTIFPSQSKFDENFDFLLIQILIQWSPQNFAHKMIAKPPWHVQQFVKIWWPKRQFQYYGISIEFKLWWAPASKACCKEHCYIYGCPSKMHEIQLYVNVTEVTHNCAKDPAGSAGGTIE